MSEKVIVDSGCVLEARGGQDFLWEILFHYVKDVDRENGRAILKFEPIWGPLSWISNSTKSCTSSIPVFCEGIRASDRCTNAV